LTESVAERLKLRPRAFYVAKAAVVRARSILWLLRSSRSSGPLGLRILFYHRISDEQDELAVTPRRFREQIAFLAEHGYRAVSVAEAAALIRADKTPERVVGMSFDDGYRDIVENAMPELERHGFGATVFVATGVVDGTSRFEWYERQPPVLAWDEIVRLAGAGTFEFGAHTVSHRDLLALDDEGARFEIEESKRVLEERLGRPAETFCYPAGLFAERHERLVAGAGFTWATSCEPGVNSIRTDPFALHRIQVDRRDTLLDFRAKLAGGHDRSLPLRNLYRNRRYRPAVPERNPDKPF